MIEQDVERRRTRRRRVVKGGRIVFGDLRYAFDCGIRDMTATGARLLVARSAEIPETFLLFEPNERVLRPARLVWRRGDEIGATFEGAAVDVDEKSDPRLARFKFA